MSESTTQNLPFLLLNIPMRDDYREAVVTRALNYREQASAAARRRLDKVLRGIQVKGFRDPTCAPMSVLLKEVVGRFHRSNALVGAVLHVWMESHPDLDAEVRNFLAARGIPIVEVCHLRDGFVDKWALTAMKDIVQDFKSMNSDNDDDDAALMLCCLTGRVPLPKDMLDAREPDVSKVAAQESEAAGSNRDNTTHQGVSGMKWEQWLDELRALAADAPEWECVAEFLLNVQRLADEKAQERHAGRERLRQALAKLVAECADELAFFDIADCGTWMAETCLLNEASAWAEQVEQFHSALERHAKLRQRTTATLAEERERRKTLTALEDEIIRTHASLAAALGPSPLPPAPTEETPEPAPEGTPPEADEHNESIEEPAPVAPTSSDTTDSATEVEIPTAPVASAAEGSVTGMTLERAAAPVQEAKPLGEAQPVELLEPTDGQTPAPTEEEIEYTPALPPGLRSPQESATILQSDDSDTNWHTFLWTLIAADDLPAAYWLSQSLTAAGRGCPIPEWLLAAAQGACWLSGAEDVIALNLLDTVRELSSDESVEYQLLRLAAALRPALIAPASGMAAWLEVPSICPALHPLVQAVQDFAKRNIALRPSDLLGVEGREQREADIRETAQAARRWLAEAPARRTQHRRSSNVRTYLARQDLRVLLEPVIQDRRDEAEQVPQQVRQWQQRNYVIDRINEIDRQLVVLKMPKITGNPRDQITHDVEEACRLATRWCELVEHEHQIEARGDWVFEQVRNLRESVRRALPEAETALRKLSNDAQPLPFAATATCLLRAVVQLCQTLHVSSPSGEHESLTESQRSWLLRDTDGLISALSRRLLLLPELALNDDGQPTEESVPQIALALRNACAVGRTLRGALESWIQKRDYRFAERLLDALQDEADTAELSRHYQEALDGSRAALREDVSKTSNEIEQAVVDGIVVEERSEYSARVEAIKAEETMNFLPQHAELRMVREGLAEARKRRLAELHDEWQEFQFRLATRIDPTKWKQVRTFVQAALERHDTRVVEECLAQLAEVLEVGGELKEDWFAPTVARDILMEFTDLVPRLEAWLTEEQRLQPIIADIRRGRTCAGIKFRELSPLRREEAAAAIEAWLQLKQRGARGRDNTHLVAILLRYLGFSLESGIGSPVQLASSGADYAHTRAWLSVSDLLVKPIPQFGSQAQGRYDVVCLWERPGADTIGARLRELRLDVRSVLVFYLGRLTVRQRHDVTRMSREQELALALMDETLLLFLAKERDSRLPVFLRCALPFAATNPYTPFQAGDVPPEMFFGREAMARELQRPSGSCLVFGGRQLGKSALLRHVQRQFHHPEREQYAWIENMKLVFDPQAEKSADSIWRRLRDEFNRMGLLSPRVTTEKPEEVARHIRKVMLQPTDRRVLVMFDEADDFLDADAKDGFRAVTALRELMLETQRRFKVIFTGLHNVQRFQGIPNQPLAHFGSPLCVGPLEPDAAQKLVREPFEALGYRFVDDATVLRILSYTNYHPGLIQLFCQELLRHLRARAGGTLPPYHVEQRDVEAVYRSQEVRKNIRERFDWTLALDARYQAIAWTMILDQMEMRDGYAQTYAPGVILRLAREWWPQGFSEVGTDQLRGLLDEMCGLGVLVRNTEGHYRLRSPNLVRLMGTEEDIITNLDELSKKRPEVKFDADSYHAPLDEVARRYSPLTYSQERSLNKQRFGVGLVFASEAIGFSSMVETFKRFIPRDLPEDIKADCVEVPSEILDGEQTKRWLEQYLRDQERYERLVVYRGLTGTGIQMAEQVRAALSVCRRHERSQRRWLRVLFLFDPQATWTWLSLSQDSRKELEDRVDVVTFPRRWNLLGVRQRLAQHDKMHSDEVCQKVLQATGGWPVLLDILFERCGAQDDPRSATQETERELISSDSDLRRHFRRCLGLETTPLALRVLEFIHKEQGVPQDLIAPEFVGGEPALSREECEAAVEYLQRMGWVELQGDSLGVETVVERVLSEP